MPQWRSLCESDARLLGDTKRAAVKNCIYVQALVTVTGSNEEDLTTVTNVAGVSLTLSLDF